MSDEPHDHVLRYLEIAEEIAALEQERELFKGHLVDWAKRTGRRSLRMHGIQVQIVPAKGGSWRISVLD